MVVSKRTSSGDGNGIPQADFDLEIFLASLPTVISNTVTAGITATKAARS